MTTKMTWNSYEILLVLIIFLNGFNISNGFNSHLGQRSSGWDTTGNENSNNNNNIPDSNNPAMEGQLSVRYGLLHRKKSTSSTTSIPDDVDSKTNSTNTDVGTITTIVDRSPDDIIIFGLDDSMIRPTTNDAKDYMVNIHDEYENDVLIFGVDEVTINDSTSASSRSRRHPHTLPIHPQQSIHSTTATSRNNSMMKERDDDDDNDIVSDVENITLAIASVVENLPSSRMSLIPPPRVANEGTTTTTTSTSSVSSKVAFRSIAVH